MGTQIKTALKQKTARLKAAFLSGIVPSPPAAPPAALIAVDLKMMKPDRGYTPQTSVILYISYR